MRKFLDNFDRLLVQRIFSSIVLIALVLVIDQWVVAFSILCIVMAAFAFYEWFYIVNKGEKVKRLTSLSMIVVLFPMIVSSYVSLDLGILGLIIMGFTLFLFLLFFYTKRHSFVLVAGIPYIGIPMNMLVWLRSDSEVGLFLISYILFVTWGSDTLAYFFGKRYGKTKLAPVISPNKTWIGFWGSGVGGMLGAIVTLIVMMLLFQGPKQPQNLGVSNIFELHWLVFIVISFFVGLIGQVGDLFESYVKRHYNVKNSGEVIPGHGGILDRIDGLLAISLVIALLHYSIKSIM